VQELERIHDQRTLVRFDPVSGRPADVEHETVEDVQAAWATQELSPFVERERRGDLSTGFVKSRKTVSAYVNYNRWLADCPACNGGIAAWPGHERGLCLDCGTIYKIEYPETEQLQRAVTALLARPPEYRHWRPWQEDAATLEDENEEHGFDRTRPLAEQGYDTEAVELARRLLELQPGRELTAQLRALPGVE
jgi:hypothetical protein